MNEDERRELGHEIRAMRKGRGMTQQQLADAAGTGVRTIRNIEAGRVEPQQGTLADILAALGYQRKERPWADDSAIEGFLQMLGYRLYLLDPEARAALMSRMTLMAIGESEENRA